jgi:GH3 auxin-responsive promoter
MALLGTLLKKGIKLRKNLEYEYSSPLELQKKELKDLLIKATQTEFGKYYDFERLLTHFRKGHRDFYQYYKSAVPIYDYNKIYKEWWHLSLKGAKNICWPGRIKYFALSSGTSETASKRIPITKEMTKAIQRAGIKQILSLSQYNLPSHVFDSGILMIGGSTHLNKRGSYFEGDLSGIQAAQLPLWFQHFYKPGKKIAANKNWDLRLDEIVKKAKKWDIAVIVGVPAWIQILLEKIIAYYQLENIHEIWPNLSVYVHSGVSLDPYRKGLDKLFARPIFYLETYLASEGFIAYQDKLNHRSMHLLLDNGIFFEFIPFNDQNFSATGDLKSDAVSLLIDEVEEGKEYALLLSTCAGAWRYLIGDVIKFVSKEDSEIVITGRTKHFLSMCGEHLSVDNMNKAIELISNEFNIVIPEFTVAGIHHDNLFAHHWYLATDDSVDVIKIKSRLDFHLKELNDDYAVERTAALKEVFVDVLPVHKFYDWMESKGKAGGQNKFPRVMRNEQLLEWQNFIS